MKKTVENFYTAGADNFDYRNGYLNFGYWNEPNITFKQAAENLIYSIGLILGLNQQSELLDCGCGTGTQDVFIINKFNPKSIEAIDVTWEHIKQAQKRAEANLIKETKLRFSHGSATELPFNNNSFSHVLSVEAPPHFNTREKFFKEAFRVLKPGGTLAICDYSLARKPRNIFENLLLKTCCYLWQVPQANIYDNDCFESILRNSGFRQIKILNVGKYVIPGYYFESRRPESVKQIKKVHGFFKGVAGGWMIDTLLYLAYKKGLCEYILLKAQKPI